MLTEAGMDYELGTKTLNRRTVLCDCCGALTGIKIVPAFAALSDDQASAPLTRNEPHHHLEN
jgi:hypothetical protein